MRPSSTSSSEARTGWARIWRRRILWLVVGALAWIAACHVIVESNDLRFFQPKAEETIRKLQVFADEAPNFDVVFLGSSRMQRAVNAATFIDQAQQDLGRSLTAFNLGVKATMMPSYTIIARDLLLGERCPKLLVLGLGARSFNSNSPRYHHTLRHLCSPTDLIGSFGPRWSSGEEWLVVPEVLFRAPATLTQLWRRGSSEERRLAEQVWEILGGNYRPLSARRKLPLFMDEADLRQRVPPEAYAEHLGMLRQATRVRIAQSRAVLLRDFEVEGRCTDAFDDLVELCRDRDIRLVVLNLPVTEQFAAGAYTRGEYDAYVGQVRELCRRGGVQFYDLNQPPYRPPDFFFRDGDHLSREGSWYFTRLVTHEILVPLLR